ncbi:GTP-binding protein 2 isoform X3 [Agrilus planipennis]|uniref:GTP-binding protein 2 isoform X3 n=1 Tax=Agrilus planipennis TaxID=224129 RepID=A0A1W4WXP5_AGRPL|nr:GTP-binding protein 2 isoform X3 [Agrilus planipennis]
MDPLVSFFDPDDCSPNCVQQTNLHNINQNVLPPEPQVGNIEYKLKIINPSKQRFEHLVTQMKWRLREGQGEAIYEIGVEDTGALTGLSCNDMTASLQTLKQMALKLGATTTILRDRVLENNKIVTEVLVRKVPDDQNNIEIRVAVLGNADAGKSTLLGVLTQGHLDNGNGRARLNMFRHLHEVQSGRTSSISHEILGFNSQGQEINYSYSDLMTAEDICEESNKLITFLDLAGHKKYIRTTIQGLSGYLPHHAMLVFCRSCRNDSGAFKYSSCT